MTEGSPAPLAKKLGLKPGGRLLTHRAPPGWDVEDVPAGTTSGVLSAKEAAGDPGDVVVVFVRARAELAAALSGPGRAIFPDGALWIAWPRRAAGHDSDVRERDIRDEALALGLVDVKVAALGEDWSGLRLVWRRERRGSGPG